MFRLQDGVALRRGLPEKRLEEMWGQAEGEVVQEDWAQGGVTAPSVQRPEPKTKLSTMMAQAEACAEAQQQAQRKAGEATPSGSCACCLQQLLPADALVLGCNHAFHRSCVASLRKYGVNEGVLCPLCRAQLPPGAENYRNEAEHRLGHTRPHGAIPGRRP